MRTELSLLLFVSIACSSLGLRRDLDVSWKFYKHFYGKTYSSVSSETLRRTIWESHLQYIQQHNIEADRGMHTYWMGESEYTDMTNKEFNHFMNGFLMTNKTSKNEWVSNLTTDPPDQVDWRKLGYVTGVKNQKKCQSCYAFSTTGSLEGQHFKKTNKLVSLSEQNLVDCSKAYGNNGCHGGEVRDSYRYIIHTGINTEKSYPYKGKEHKKCKFKYSKIGANMTGFVNVQRGSENALKQAVAEVGPISVAIDSTLKSFQHYKKGVYRDSRCSSTELTHCVLAVGYGYVKGEKVWIVKNSYGKSWGEKGYINIARDENNMCGIATEAMYPRVG